MPPNHDEQQLFARKGAHLTSFPAEALANASLKVLDLSTNDIATIPPGIFPKLSGLEVCDLSRNKVASLPDDIGALQKLQRLSVAHNKLTSLPDSLCQITTLVWLNIKSNSIQRIRGNIRLWNRLQVLNVSNNNLEILPADVGWLPLKELHVSGNPNLRIPQTVLKHGFKAIISYLQVVCEQHRLVERHLSRFTHPDVTADDADAEPSFDSTSTNSLSVEQRISEAANTGILDFKGCATPDALEAAKQDLHAVYVADLRSSRCTELDDNVLSFENLVILNASFNQISWIADGVVPGSLGVLNASFNKLEELPSSLGSSPVLQQMYLANNQLSDLPESFASLPIVDLFLSENEFTRIPRALLGMGQLAKLSIACCKLQELSEELGKMDSLRFLDVSFNELQDLPESLANLTSLNALNISFNPLQTFPKIIPSLTALLELNLDFTNVSDLPPDIGKLRHLEGLQIEGNHFEEPLRSLYHANPLLLVQIHNTALTSLDLSGIGLTCFPIQLASLTDLSALNLSRNKIPSFPPELGLLTNVRHLSVKENPLVPPFRQIAEVHGSRSIIDYMDSKGTKLDLSNCELHELPEQVLAHGTHLQQLKLANNKLADLPPSFTTLEALNTLVLDYNALQAVPEVVLKLPKLSILMASCNQFTTLPTGIGACSNLQAIVLQSNGIAELPSSISSLVDLKALGLASNKIQGPLPELLGSCTALRLLDISSNQITSLPTSMGRLQKLKTLKACNNQLSNIPHQFRDLRSLQELYLEGNPFKLQGPAQEPQAFNASSSSAVKKVLDVLLPDTPASPPAAEPRAASQEQQPQQEQRHHDLLHQPQQQLQQPLHQYPKEQQQHQQPDSQPPPSPLPQHQQQQQQQQQQPPSPLPQHQQQQQQQLQPALPPPSPLPQHQQQQQQQQQKPQSQQSSQQGPSPLPPNSPLESVGREDRDAQSVVAQIGRLSMSNAKPPSAQITPKESIVTAESAEGEASKRRLHDQASKHCAKDKWLFLQKHADTIAKDPLRPKAASGWDRVPLTDIPRLLAAMSNPPPPPPPSNDNAGPPKRPQTMQRFRRVVDQSNMAVRLLGRVGSELGQQQHQQQQQHPYASPPQQQ